MAIEFNLLYRWHSLVPSTFDLGGEHLTIEQTTVATSGLTDAGLGPFMAAASVQPAGRIGLFNTHELLVSWAEKPSIQEARTARLASYNDYRRLCGFLPLLRFEEFPADKEVREALWKLYGNVENIEFYVGLFAERVEPNSVLPPLMTAMVAFDAFSQVLTNPLLAPRIYNEQTFSPAGMKIIEETKSISELVHRNTPGSEQYFVSLTRKDYKRM
jgi:prostaglandin-endoperoxide synthase 2